MAFVQRFAKAGCTKFKDINWDKVSELAKVDVPPMVNNAAAKAATKFKRPFDVKVEVDAGAEKGRITFHSPSGEAPDERVEWSTVNPQLKKGIASVKAALKHMWDTNRDFEEKMKLHVAAVKNLKKQVAEIEAMKTEDGLSISRRRLAAIQESIERTKAELRANYNEAMKLVTEHNNWVLAVPRKGLGPLLTAARIELKEMPKADQDALTNALAETATETNKIRTLLQIDVENASNALEIRLNNFWAMLTETAEGARKTIATTYENEVGELERIVTKFSIELKLDKTRIAIEDFTAGDGIDFTPKPLIRYRDPAGTWDNAGVLKHLGNEKASNNTRREHFEKYGEWVAKQQSRLLKSIPEAFREEEMFKQIGQGYEQQVERFRQTRAEAAHLFDQYDQLMDAFIQLHHIQ